MSDATISIAAVMCEDSNSNLKCTDVLVYLRIMQHKLAGALGTR